MSALPVPEPSSTPALAAPTWPLTAAEYAQTPETEARYELQEGAIVMAASPVPRHQDWLFRLAVQLDAQVPPKLRMLIEVDIDLALVPPDQPGTVRCPDLVVVTQAGYQRVDEQGGLLRADDVVLAVEIHSKTTRRTDTKIKYAEYADAGIGHYWMVDLLDGPSLTACHLGGEFGYIDAEPVRGTFTTQQPFPARIDLTPTG